MAVAGVRWSSAAPYNLTERSRWRRRSPLVRPGRHTKGHTIEALSHADFDRPVRGLEAGVAAQLTRAKHYQKEPGSMHFDITTAIGILGGVFYLASHYMKAMVPLRVLALVSSVIFLIFSVLHTHFDITELIVLPEFILNLILLPINLKRLGDINRLTKQVEQATVESPVSEGLLPHMHLRKHKAGEVLFRKGDVADKIVYVASGKLKLQGIDHFIGPGELIGEIGLFSPEKVRTLTVVCVTDCELYQMTDEQIYRLYYQNPKLGFFFMRLIVERLLRDVKRGVIEPGTV